MKARLVHIAILVLLAVLADGTPAAAAPKRAAKAARTPETKATPSVAAWAMRQRPSGAERAYVVSEILVEPPASVRGNIITQADAKKVEKMFSGAVVFRRDAGARIVMTEAGTKDSGVSYLEIRGSTSGFGVNASTSAKQNYLVANYRLAEADSEGHSGMIVVQFDLQIVSTGVAAKRQGAKVRLAADFVQDLRRRTKPPAQEADK